MLVHICAKGLSWGQQAAFEGRVTLDTGVLGLEANRRKKPQQENADAIAFETDHR
jgi:CRISPR/Cas system-associated endoribonuclease Cas2